ncbi:MAG TPA: hemagglutinin [Sphingobacteriaceae bacterium]|nr:hemagglutinin [Sphingobacteriaceae bacterium]
MLKRCITVVLLFTSCATFGQSVAAKYIELYKDAAIKIMNENGIPASIVLGVAIHESGSGTSKIARILNNHFGFKGQNSSNKIQSAYKEYDSVEASYADFAFLLKDRSKFRPLFDQYSSFDYFNWAKGIQRAGYASSKTWASQVLAIIKKYELYQYDNRPADYVEPVPEPVVNSSKSSPVKETTIYKVKAGDNLSEIAEKFNTTVKAIKNKNGLKTNNLSIGQKLKL